MKGKVIDVFSLGHIVFGLNINSFFTLLFQFNLTYRQGIVMSPLSLLVFIGWELIEHTFVYKFIYSRVLKNWAESKTNSLLDVVISGTTFYIAFLILYVLIYDILVSIINLFISLSLIPIVAIIIMKSNKKNFINFDKSGKI
ncbi:MAG: hypothetical protein ACFFDX_13435 [Candidatus Odinarchaeota archaeon]